MPSGKVSATLPSFLTVSDTPTARLTAAPIAPWFDEASNPSGGYATVFKNTGASTSWYNIQFYNQDNDYSDCTVSATRQPSTSAAEMRSIVYLTHTTDTHHNRRRTLSQLGPRPAQRPRYPVWEACSRQARHNQGRR
jgi:hypothetical protein